MTRIKWTKGKLVKEAKKFKTRAEFKNSSGSAYVTARRMGILDDACKHMRKPKIKPANFWTPKKIAKEARKYKTKMEFQSKCPSAYSAAGKLGIRDEVCSHMINNLWTQEKILKEAKKYDYYSDFIKHSASAYMAAKRLRILGKVKSILKMQKLTKGFWSFEKLLKEAQKYDTKTEFSKGNSIAYNAARKSKKWDKLTSHMERKSMPSIWNEEKLKKLAKKYSNRTSFTKDNPGAVKAAKRLGIYKIITSHMKYKVKPNGTWTKKMVKEIALKYKTRGTFQKHSHDAYLAARRLNIMDEVCAHMKRVGNRFKRALYAFEFSDKSVYVGLTFNYDKRYKAHLKNNKLIINKTYLLGHEFIMFNEYYDIDKASREEAKLINKYKKAGWAILNKAKAGALGSNIRKWTKSEILKEAKKYNSISEFSSFNGSAYNAALKLGLKDQIKKDMKNLRKPTGFWTKEAIIKEAKKYKTRSEFHKSSPTAFAYSKKLGIREECCKHMTKPEHKSKWNYDNILSEAKKYKYRNEFQKNSRGAYKAAKKLGIFDEVCKHMIYKINPNNTWNKENILKEAIKYSKRSHFKKASGSAYNAAKRLGIIDEVCSHMNNSRIKKKVA